MSTRTETPSPDRPGHWRPAPAIQVSIAVHVIAALALVFQPAAWGWVLAVIFANHLVLSAAVLWPRGRLLGPNLTRLCAAAAARREIVLTFDDGPDPEVTPKVLDLLDRHAMKASFFCIGVRAEAFPEIVKTSRAAGTAWRTTAITIHMLLRFSAFHVWRARWRQRRPLSPASRGARRAFSAPPPVSAVHLLDPILARRGLQYASWTRRSYDTVRIDPQAALIRLTRGLAAGDVLLLHDGSAARTAEGIPMVLAVLPALLDTLEAQRLKSVALPTAA